MTRVPHEEPPLNPIPPVVLGLVVVILGLELLFSLGASGFVGGPAAVGWRLAAAQDWGFHPLVLTLMAEGGAVPVTELVRLLSFPLIHASFTHALFAAVILLAIGKMVGEVFGPVAVLAVFFLGGAAGAAIWAVVMQDRFLLIGAYPGDYALIGAYSWLLWRRLGQLGQRQVMAFRLIGVLLVFQLASGLIFGGTSDWLADVSAFVVGFLMSFVIRPGGLRAIRDRMRHD